MHIHSLILYVETVRVPVLVAGNEMVRPMEKIKAAIIKTDPGVWEGIPEPQRIMAAILTTDPGVWEGVLEP